MNILNYYFVLQYIFLEIEVENVRRFIISVVFYIRLFGEEVVELVRKLGQIIQQIEGGVQVVQSDEGFNVV